MFPFQFHQNKFSACFFTLLLFFFLMTFNVYFLTFSNHLLLLYNCQTKIYILFTYLMNLYVFPSLFNYTETNNIVGNVFRYRYTICILIYIYVLWILCVINKNLFVNVYNRIYVGILKSYYKPTTMLFYVIYILYI